MPEYKLHCRYCKELSLREEWKDDGDGMCSEGCCDRLICPKCGASCLFECGD